ncbi:MAG: sigma-70 family RNA polymerase sigma factor [Clostridia bacterium]|nr:sigma-70 family RNA polymerase sigma factor [Clostridia bacterium]
MDVKGFMPQYSLLQLPILALILLNDSDRELVESVYFQHRQLMFHVARKYFSDKPDELEDVISIALERMCRYVPKIREVPGNKIQAYVVLIVENVCKTRLSQIIKERKLRVVQYDDRILQENEEYSENPYDLVFDYADTRALLASFKGLSQRDQDIIWMRHVDQMDYPEMAVALGMQEGAVRTALTRAKARLEKAAREGGVDNE